MIRAAHAVAEPTAAPAPRLDGVRVLIILPTLGLGGAERQAFLLAREMAHREGALVRIVSMAPADIPVGLVESCEKEGLSWDRFTLKHTYGERFLQLWDLIRFVRFLRRERPDVLMSYCMFPNIVCALTWRLGGVQVCVWNQRDEGRSRVMRWVERLAVGQVGRFLSNAQHGAEFLTTELAVPSSQVQVIHNGIEPLEAKLDRGEWRRRLGLSDTAFVACMVANLHGFKDHETLVAAWKRVVDHLKRSGREAHLLLAGAHGNRSDAIRNQIETLGLADSIHLLGTIADIGGILRAIDLSVFSSFNEGLPNAVLEAMSAGVAVVATDYPGIREAVGAAGEPYLARPRNANDLADKIILVAEDAQLRARLGCQGRTRVAAAFSINRMTDATVEVVVKELATHKRTRSVPGS